MQNMIIGDRIRQQRITMGLSQEKSEQKREIWTVETIMKVIDACDT